VGKRRTFPAHPAALAAVREFAREQAMESGVSAQKREQVAAAVEQAFASALTRPSTQPVEVRLLVSDDRIEVEFLPYGDSKSSLPRGGERWSGSFSLWLSEELKERGLSQEAAARRIGVSLKTVSRWVRGETEPRFRELALIQRAFGEQPISLPARSSDQI
jgi:DNA-binding XRE family transcriptional regulator